MKKDIVIPPTTYLDLFDLILDPLDGVSVDVVADLNLLLSH